MEGTVAQADTFFFLPSPRIKEAPPACPVYRHPRPPHAPEERKHTEWDKISLCAPNPQLRFNKWRPTAEDFQKISNLYLNKNPSFLGGFTAAECVKPVHTKPQKNKCLLWTFRNMCTWRQKRSVFQSVPSFWLWLILFRDIMVSAILQYRGDKSVSIGTFQTLTLLGLCSEKCCHCVKMESQSYGSECEKGAFRDSMERRSPMFGSTRDQTHHRYLCAFRTPKLSVWKSTCVTTSFDILHGWSTTACDKYRWDPELRCRTKNSTERVWVFLLFFF